METKNMKLSDLKQASLKSDKTRTADLLHLYHTGFINREELRTGFKEIVALNNKTELIYRGTNLAICPRCGNGNAMLDRADFVEDHLKITYYCRDCEFEVEAENVVHIQTELDKEGMGAASTYSETDRYELNRLGIRA